MGDIIVLAKTVVAKPDANNIAVQNILEAVDVSSYDSIDFQVALLATTGSPNAITVSIITSMQVDTDDPTSTPAAWPVLASTSNLTTSPVWTPLIVPASAAIPMFRYIRWKLTFTGGTNPTAIFSITGVGRRGVR